MSLLYVQGKSFINVDERNGAKVSQHPELNVFLQKENPFEIWDTDFPSFFTKTFHSRRKPPKIVVFLRNFKCRIN